MKSIIVDNESNSSDSPPPPPASPYSRRHPRRKRRCKGSVSKNQATQNIAHRIAPPVPVNETLAAEAAAATTTTPTTTSPTTTTTTITPTGGNQQYDEIVELPDYEKFEQPVTVYQQRRLDAAASESFVFNFDSAQSSSPYSRRYPSSVRKMRQMQTADWTPSSSEPEEFINKNVQTDKLADSGAGSGDRDERGVTQAADDDQRSTSDFALPVVLHRYQSMQSLRHRRDPNYHGMRSRRAKRVIDKTGERNVGFLNIPERSWRFFKDFFTTLIDEQWRYVITVFALSFFLCWILFAALWYLIAHAHGDLNFDKETGERLSDGPVPCVEGAYSFAGFLLFSIETQVSIGFGEKFPNEECPEAIFLMVVQIVMGIAIEGAMVGIVYAKMIRPSRHSSDMKFSRKAVICKRNSKLCLVFRVCDSRSNHVIDSKVQAYWFAERYSIEGEKLRQFQYSLKLENGGRIFLIFPMTVCHVIDENSPLYDLSARDLLEKKFEIVITLTGSSRSTGQMTQARTSYLPKEIMWGNRFINMTHYDKANEVYVADYDKFDETVEIDTPLCSARRLEEVMAEVQQYFANVDDFSEYDAEHLNYMLARDDQNNESTSRSGGGLYYSHYNHEEKGQNNTNEILQMEMLVEELEFKLSQHSLNVLAQQEAAQGAHGGSDIKLCEKFT